jgi:predicted  nucleic acid-binding Zn-ribbon protein
MRLRRLLLLQPNAELEPQNGTASATIQRDESDWDVLAELDRLRTTNSGLTAEVQRQTQIGQDYARVASEQRFRVEELERETAIAHTSAQMLDRRVTQAEERAEELEELVEVLRAQRDRLETYYEQQKERADRAESASAAMRDAASDLLAAADQQTHAALGTRGLARAKVEFADGLAKLRRSLDRNAGQDFLAPAVAEEVRRYFTATDLSSEEKGRLKQSIVRALSVKP